MTRHSFWLSISINGSCVLEHLRIFLISKLRRSWSDEPPFEINEAAAKLGLNPNDALLLKLEKMDRLAGLLTHSLRINGTPRIVKRMLNVIRMRSSVARHRQMALDESNIAKLALFERCTSED